MDFEDFLPDESKPKEEELTEVEITQSQGIGHTQVYDIITSRKPDWQQIIYDLISSEQLDPWDIDLVILTRKYFEKVIELEEQDFYVSSKVLLAASLLLRIKSEYLLNKYIKSIDEILFGKKDENKYVIQKIEINEDDLPVLIPKTPMSRLRKVTLNELISALNKAIETESRRIKREVAIKRAKKLSEVDFPTFRRIDLKDRIKQFYAKVLTNVKRKQLLQGKKHERHSNSIGFLDLVGTEKEQKLASFLPLLHLSNSQKLWLEQEKHMDEIWIFLYDYFDKHREQFIHVVNEMEEELEDFSGFIEDESFEPKNPQARLVGETEDMIREVEADAKNEDLKEKNKLKEKDTEKSQEEIVKEILNEKSSFLDNLKKEIEEIDKEKRLEEETGFSQE